MEMSPSVGRDEESMPSGKPKLPQHRYYTRSSRGHESQRNDYRHSSEERRNPQTTHQMARKPNQLSIRQRSHPSDNVSQNEIESNAQESDSLQPEEESMMMIDSVTYSTSNPVRAPFPSPAMKSTQPIYPFPPTQTQQGNSHSENYNGQETSWHQSGAGVGGQCILVEAANRAQMAILVDDMGMMGIEQMEQT